MGYNMHTIHRRNESIKEQKELQLFFSSLDRIKSRTKNVQISDIIVAKLLIINH